MLRLLAFVLVAVSLAAPAQAQSRRELAARLDAAEARLAEMEDQALAGDPVAETLTVRIDALEREQRVLTGEIERLAFENRRLRDQMEQMQRSIDAIMSGGASTGAGMAGGDGPAILEPNEIDPNDPFAEARAESVQPLRAPGRGDQDQGASSGQTGADAGGPSELAAPNAIEDPETLFQRGRTRLMEGDFIGAREAFQAYTADHPDAAQADEAYYWLGETWFVNGDLDAAADAYIASLQADRQGAKAADALVRLGASLAGLGETDRACQVLATFPVEFPDAAEEARRKAAREVARIGC